MINVSAIGGFLTLALLFIDLYASFRAFGINPFKGFKKDEEPQTEDYVAVNQ